MEDEYQALEAAQQCLRITREDPDQMQDFDLAFAQELLARAYALDGQIELAQKHYLLAVELGENIKDPEDQKIFQNDLVNGKWFQLELTGK
jgi:hypothetical protein